MGNNFVGMDEASKAEALKKAWVQYALYDEKLAEEKVLLFGKILQTISGESQHALMTDGAWVEADAPDPLLAITILTKTHTTQTSHLDGETAVNILRKAYANIIQRLTRPL